MKANTFGRMSLSFKPILANLINDSGLFSHDLNNFRAVQDGLSLSGGGDWVSLHRNAGQDTIENGITTSVTGMSEQPMRNMFAAWKKYMSNGG